MRNRNKDGAQRDCMARCIQCYRCWSIARWRHVIKDGKVSGIDYVHTKGCGVVVKCPTKDPALELINESEAIES